MSTKTLIGLWIAIAFIVGAVAILTSGPQTFPDTQSLIRFQRAADDYAFMHRRIERRLAPLAVTADAETIRRAVDAMAAAIRVAREGAHEGDLLDPAVQRVFRARIATVLRDHGLTAADLSPEDVDVTTASLTINGEMPWRLTDATPPCVLEVLPALPPELEYRFVGGDLVLVDVHASLIVDILRHAASAADTF